jgi:methionyl-tRNA formyltransferase
MGMRILFVGTVKFSNYMLETLIDNGAEVVGVITGSDNGLNSDYVDLAPVCEENEIAILLADRINEPNVLEWVRKCTPEVIFCMGWSRLIGSELLQLPPLGVIGYHPAELPHNRGRHPLIWALVLGLKRTASTFFIMDEGADSGDIIDQQPITIAEDDDASTLYAKMVEVAQGQINKILPLLTQGNYLRVPQNHAIANTWRKRGKPDGEIDWRMSARNIHNLVRGLTHPYIGAHCVVEGKEYKVWKSRVVTSDKVENLEPGKLVAVDDLAIPTIKCGEGSIELLEVDPILPVRDGDYL